MSPRHLARSIILQVLFIWDFNDQDSHNLNFYIDYNINEFAAGLADQNFVTDLIEKIVAEHAQIDQFINHYAQEWPVDRLTIIDRNILRLAIFEMFNSPAVPTKVALNEAVELAKQYSGESSQKFVSGVLGAIYEDYFKNEKKPFPFGTKT